MATPDPNEASSTATRAMDGNRLVQLFRRAPNFMCVLRGSEHRIEFANDAFESLVGRSAFIGKRLAEALPEAAAQGFIDLLDQVYRLGESHIGRRKRMLFEAPAQAVPSERFVDFVFEAIKEADGRSSGVVVSGFDVTSSVRIEQGLRDTIEFQRLLLDSTSEGFYSVDSAGVTTLCNNAFVRMLGFESKEDAIGRKLHDVIHHTHPDGTHYSKEECPIYQTATFGRPAHVEHELFFRLDGNSFPVEYRVHPMLSDGNLTGAICTFVDITERLRDQQALRDADRRKDEFLATLAHELRNPLAPIRNSLAILRTAAGGDTDARERLQGVMERQVRQLARLVDDLLDVSRISSGKIELRRQRVQLRDVVEAALEAARPLVEARGHELSVIVSAASIALEADAARLSQAIVNLLDNAAKYTPTGGRVTLAAGEEGAEAVVTVTDNGIGLEGAMLERVFELFVQADDSLERSHGGLGIGLSLVRRLVELHGGSVSAQSEGQGRGSRFTLRLPKVGGVERVARPATFDAIAPAASVAHRILVVDDNEDAAVSLRELLQVMGHEVQIAHDGLAALELAASYRPNVVFLDIAMPAMSGYDVVRRLRGMPAANGACIAALSGYGSASDRARSVDAGFDVHLVKPIEPERLRQFLATCDLK